MNHAVIKEVIRYSSNGEISEYFTNSSLYQVMDIIDITHVAAEPLYKFSLSQAHSAPAFFQDKKAFWRQKELYKFMRTAVNFIWHLTRYHLSKPTLKTQKNIVMAFEP